LALALAAGGALTVDARIAAQAQATPNPHIGHVLDSFMNTPDKKGLLPTAMAEAATAAAHAGLAAKASDNLAAMKLHAGHVIHAVDPSVEATGPGLGYGVKRAATGVAQHITLAAGTAGASANIKTHATHVAAAANTVAQRADEIVALAQRIRAATTAADAAPLAAQLATLCQQLTTGVDANKDGTIGWQTGEGGLQQAQQHMDLMKKGEGG
jgi:hypothetical protein